MCRILLVGVLLLCGCQGVRGPFDAVSPRRVDDPRLPIDEQERLGRDRYAFPEQSDKIGPTSGIERPGTFGVR